MFKDIKSINIKGGFFEEEKNINLFKNKDDRISFIYGRNGSGKTSISNAFFDLKKNINSNYSVLRLNDFDQKEITLTEEEKSNIYIFNETFIDNKIKFSEDGMNTIVMFGKQIELEEELKKYNEEFLKLKKEYKIEQQKKEKIENEKDSMSPIYYKNKMLDILKSEISWATREQKIKNLSRKSSVGENILNSIISMPLKKDIKAEITELEENITFLSTMPLNNNKYPELIFEYKLKEKFEKHLKELLLKKIEKPKLNEREKLIFEILEKGMQEIIDSAKNYFSKNISYCPYCFQPIDYNYKEKLINSFKKVLNENVQQHIEILSDYILTHIDIDLSDYMCLNSGLCITIYSKIDEVNKHMDFINNSIDNKIKNVYIPISISGLEIEKLIIELTTLVNKLKLEIKQYNQKIDNINETITNSQNLNKIIARNEIDSYLIIYNEKLKFQHENNEKLLNLKKLGNEIKNKIDQINAQKKSFDIALKKINEDLEYIFFGKERLSLVCKHDKYMVLSYGQKVELKKLSIGERNAIALCYFFAQILENTDETNEYTNNFLLIIDDPISSFDFENKIGMYSFLRLKLSRILNNNPINKVIIFTHEIDVMINFQKFKEELKKFNMSYLTLFDKQTKDFGKFDKNSYTQAFNIMYQYALKPNDEYDLTIGNSMRKILEAFSTFQCKNSMELFMRDEDILKLIPYELRNYFENFMYRLVLNSESHLSDQAISFPDSNFYEFISQKEKQITAKNLISFIYMINPVHVKKQLGNNSEFIKNVDKWKNELIESYKKN